ncbi:hypothetical protein B0T20DRAFT_349563 [Sordaria brevicollis]|uniref:Uncharacterized protein n=1 Tax=Sordaria brevicollis TaxID=83679 RepID=A0AAE0PGQ7_SORBR|nr:hypothetical protein B0T20DRAFT_349563 [Sordaria brevicollis]
MGWTMTVIIDKIYKEQTEHLQAISVHARTHTETLKQLGPMMVAVEKSVTVLETQARQLDALLKVSGVKDGERPWMPCHVRLGLPNRCEKQDRLGNCSVHLDAPG